MYLQQSPNDNREEACSCAKDCAHLGGALKRSCEGVAIWIGLTGDEERNGESKSRYNTCYEEVFKFHTLREREAHELTDPCEQEDPHSFTDEERAQDDPSDPSDAVELHACVDKSEEEETKIYKGLELMLKLLKR